MPQHYNKPTSKLSIFKAEQRSKVSLASTFAKDEIAANPPPKPKPKKLKIKPLPRPTVK